MKAKFRKACKNSRSELHTVQFLQQILLPQPALEYISLEIKGCNVCNVLNIYFLVLFEFISL